jgi:glycosyltransferase involved in cell wall biosynthesis
VICTRNRDDKIGTAVASVLANDYSSFDLTIIDQSTTDATGVAVREVAAGDARVHYVHSNEPGLSRAYNNGIRCSSGEILAFTDDDCIAPPDWIGSIVAAFLAEPEGDLLYGEVVAAGEAPGDIALTPSLRFPTPRRLKEVEGGLVGQVPDRKLFEKAGRAAAEAMVRVSGRRPSMAYKVPALERLVAWGLGQACGRTGEE